MKEIPNDPIEIVCQVVRKYGDHYMVSPNTLQKRTEPYHLNYEPIREPMVRCESSKNQFEFSMENFFIAKTKKDDLAMVLQRMEPRVKQKGLFGLPSLSQATKDFKKHERIYLAFTAFEKGKSGFKQIAESLISHSIYNGNDKRSLNICCNPQLPFEGGINMHLLLSDVQHDYKIEIRRDDGQWTTHLISPIVKTRTLKELHKVLIYPTPKYDATDTEKQRTSVNCKLILYDADDSTEIQTVDVVYARYAVAPEDAAEDFAFYCNEGDDQDRDQFNILELMEDDANMHDILNMSGSDFFNMDSRPSGSQEAHASSDIAQNHGPDRTFRNNQIMVCLGLNYIRNAKSLEEAVRINERYLYWLGTGSTSIFHEALKLGLLKYIRQAATSIENKDAFLKYLALLKDGRNATVLHILASTAGHSDEDAAWLISSCAVYDLTLQKNRGETFLHIAVDNQKVALLETIMKSLTTKQMLEVLTVWDISGNNPLHSAIVNNKLESFKWLLKCYQKLNVNACEVRTLGYGSTPLHLVIESNRRHPYEELILTAYNDAGNYENYAGFNAYNECMSETQPDCMMEELTLGGAEESASDSLSDDNSDDDDHHHPYREMLRGRCGTPILPMEKLPMRRYV
ncbi:uncharacterized protein LOC115632750 [Scaptodrosophila lebanonensis]|uniref:Uncharacterized protein LOC115632750 n=1 Tax=Drosophila lebanonensis TaxID=7225 RepID=A0A6J2UEM2_DROLE|nr:uncharacterized protein LOC115632750 [Scaptodrosophila lebanonensis]